MENHRLADQDKLSLGDTCLFCQHQASEANKQPEIKRSGEEALPQDYTRVIADKVAGQSKVAVRAEGDVIIERNQEVLNADWADYDQISDTVRAGDRFKLYQDGSTVSGDTLVYNLKDNTGSSEYVRVDAEKDGRRLQSVSEKAEMKGKGLYKLINTKFNTCSPGDASWYIKAKSIETDQETGIGVAKDASLVFGGVPVLYTPWADFPLNGHRKSGLLVPTLATGSDGLELALPYYFNLAPNLDATFRPGIISSRGVQLGGQVRYLEPKFNGVIDGDWMPHDKKRHENNRYQIKFDHNHQLTDKLSGGISFNQVSDDNYYRDFYGREDIASNVNLNRQLWLNYGDNIWGGSFDGALNVQKYQTLANQNGYKDEPYAIMPRLSGRWQKNFAGNLFSVYGQYTRFAHDSKQAGGRLVLYPSFSRHLHNDWGYIRPKVGLHYTHYSLDSFNGKSSRSAGRALPIVNVDTGLTLERETGLFGREHVQTLEPRLFYNYIPTKSQNDLPNFDTSENSFNYEQLFRENLYSGHDRINAANSLSVALQTRYLDKATGAERLRAGVGQKFYFKNDSVLIDGNISQSSRNRSDWVAFADGEISRSVSGYTSVHFNENRSRFDSASAGIRYRPQDGKVLGARYKYGRDEPIYLQSDGTYFRDKLSQIDLAAQWPIRQNLYGVARFNYALNVRRPLDILAGLEYKSSCGCWSATAVAQRYVTGWNIERNKLDYKNAAFLTLQLKNLSNIGSKTEDTLRPAIPGYIKTNEVVK